ncbi:hypothetical protein N431DRAFT_345338 [Stipitochalara longipes BDJ]|nr:hypothetical protein N431DRAFT_345338 [Stipitochalara longipes BDJ]
MAGSLPQPRISKTSQNTQLSYELPHRIHTARVYPVHSSNGSTIILYGHENGVKLVWKGGRPFKNAQEATAPAQKANGTGNAVISLDSDDEGDSGKAFEDKPEFEDEEEELHPSRPYLGILQELDLHFGTDVLHLSILPDLVLKADGSSARGLESLKQKIVFTAACADNILRLVTVPLTPPSPKSKARPELRADFTLAIAGKGTWGETVVLLNGHQKPSDGVSMTLEFANEQKSQAAETQIVVASHSREVTGRLLLFKIPLKSPRQAVEPFQSVYLASPAKSISFNPSLYRQLTSHLLIADSIGVCRIYDYKASTKVTEDSDSPATDGTWLISLYTGFQSTKNDSQPLGTHAGFGRKTIIDAQWVSAGRAVIVLLSDGEWAVWDIEPGASQGVLPKAGLQGGSRTKYSLTGYIDAVPKSRTSGPPQITSSKFAPMTPGTRKSTEPFGSRASNVALRGQISVLEVPSSSPTSPSEESVLFWLGETFTIIPNLSKYWAANAGKKSGPGPFTGTPGTRAIKLDNVELQGERCSAVAQISNSSTGTHPDVVIVAEHRFVILSTGKPVRQSEGRIVLVEKSTNGGASGGELDVVGIEQALARMENGMDVRRKIF